MAINVNTVYKTVLSILNKEQRGYMTPDEFNKVATQVQLDIFEKYFNDLNQQVRVPQTDTDYANRIANIEEKMSFFNLVATNVLNSSTGINLRTNTYYLNNLTFKDIDMQKVTRNELLRINKSPLTQPTEDFPVYIQEGLSITAFPDSINSHATSTDVVAYYIREPNPVNWTFSVGDVGQYVYNSDDDDAADFELSVTEQVNVIIRILAYAGVIIKDPQIVQAASQVIQSKEINSKS